MVVLLEALWVQRHTTSVIENFLKIAEPMTRFLKKDATTEWRDEQTDAFEQLKQLLTKQPVLCHYDSKLPIELRTDASGYKLGAILLQEFSDKIKRVIAYASRLLQRAEVRYCISENECLAILLTVKKFKPYLQGTKFKVVTDLIALTWLQGKRELNVSSMRWTIELQTYDYTFEYKSGKKRASNLLVIVIEMSNSRLVTAYQQSSPY